MVDENFNMAIKQILVNEGGYTDGTNQVKDMPTNMGIQQKTLDFFNRLYPDKKFPNSVKVLNASQAIEIYKALYWDNTKIPQIRNDRIRNAVFDMNVMGGAGIVVQRALNQYLKIDLAVDGTIGDNTLNSINSISDNCVADFIEVLKKIRIEYLRKTPNWPTAKNGWISRTEKY